jgi:hypothetical protein
MAIWYAISANRIIAPILHEATIDAEKYINEILGSFSVNLAPAEERFSYFMQDDATPHTTKEIIRTLRSVFEEFNA